MRYAGDKIRNLGVKKLYQKIITPRPRTNGLRGGGYLAEFSISSGFFCLAGLVGGGSILGNLTVFKIYFFIET